MTQNEMITDFKLEGASVRDLFKAVNAHLKRCGIEAEDRDFGVGMDDNQMVPPYREWRWLVAWTNEGTSEGYYIHIGTIRQGQKWGESATYTDFGHAKCYSADQAYQITKEAQRFLIAAMWN